MKVDPDQVIKASEGAKISHDGSGTLVVTIKNEDGVTVTVEVPAGQTVTWYPPAGWRTAKFNATGHQQEYRTIDQGADAEGQEESEG